MSHSCSTPPRKTLPSSVWHDTTPEAWPGIFIRLAPGGVWRVYRLAATTKMCTRPWRVADTKGKVLRDGAGRVRCFPSKVDAMLAANACILQSELTPCPC